MPRYWVIAPVESKSRELFDRVWQFDLTNELISIGWEELGDVSKLGKDDLVAEASIAYPSKPPGSKGLIANMIRSFYHEISQGDLIIARRGRKTLAAVGTVKRAGYYAPGRNPDHGHPNYLDVVWDREPRDVVFPSVVFPMYSVAEITEARFRSFVEGSAGQLVPTEAPDAIEDPNEFVLEKYLEDFIVSNFETIFRGELRVYEDAEGNDGQQYATEIGPIDILAIDPKSNSFVVIELKKGRPSDQVVGQILRYMGWVKKNLCSSGQSVTGLVICREPDVKLSYALEMTSNIKVRYYSVSFKLREIA